LVPDSFIAQTEREAGAWDEVPPGAGTHRRGRLVGRCSGWSGRKDRGYDSAALRLVSHRAVPIAFALALVALCAVAPNAFADAITPESGGSPNADDIDELYKVVLYVAIVIFVLVEGVLIWSLVRFRQGRGGPPAAQIRGNTPLEIGWTVGAALILVVLTVITFTYLDDIKNPPPSDPGGLDTAAGLQFASVDQPKPPGGKALEIGVVGRQYLWRYDYPGKFGELFAYYEMVVPTKTTVTLKIFSSDVAHSWWIPELGGKADSLPGHTNETWFKVRKPGVYEGECAELCGDNHADMRARVRAVPPDQYLAWAEQQRADIKAAQAGLAAQRKEREAAEAG
jgi:cytochrome c oxidase subunit 2